MLSRGQVERTERDVNTLKARVRETWRARGQSQNHWREWQRAADDLRNYQSSVSALWNEETLALIRAGDRNALEGALSFLEADPYFYRSGYLKEKVLHAIKSSPWERNDELRLQTIVLRAIEGRYKREIKFYTRLIPRLRDDNFENKLRLAAARANSSNHWRLTLLALDSHL